MLDKLKQIKERLSFIHDRLVMIHEESSNVDYMIRLRSIIEDELDTLPRQELSELEKQVFAEIPVLVETYDHCATSDPWDNDVYTIQIHRRKKAPVWKVGMGFNFGSGYFQVINAMDQGYAVIDEKATTVFCFNEWAELIEEYYNPTPIKQADLMSTIATRAQEV